MAYHIPLHVAVKLSCLTIGLWIFLSKDNVLLLLQYDTGGGGQSAVLPGKAENLRNVNCSCHGSVIMGGILYIKLTFPDICLWYVCVAYHY